MFMEAQMPKNRRKFIVVVVLGFVGLALAVGGAQAAMRSILLNSPATFPVDI